MRFRKSGLIVAILYLLIEIVLFVIAALNPGPGYEYIPFQLGELPWVLLFRFSGYYLQLISIPLNMILIYGCVGFFSTKRRP